MLTGSISYWEILSRNFRRRVACDFFVQNSKIWMFVIVYQFVTLTLFCSDLGSGMNAGVLEKLGLLAMHIITSSNGNIFRVTGLCAGNSPDIGEFPTQRPLTRGFDVFFDLGLNQQLSKQWRRQWFKTPSLSLWRKCNELTVVMEHTSFYKVPGTTLLVPILLVKLLSPI